MTKRITDERLAEIIKALTRNTIWDLSWADTHDLAADLREERAKVAECIALLKEFETASASYDDFEEALYNLHTALLAKLSGDVK